MEVLFDDGRDRCAVCVCAHLHRSYGWKLGACNYHGAYSGSHVYAHA